MSDATTGVPEANASVSTIPKLSPPSDGAQSRSAWPSRRHLSASSTRPASSTPSGSSSSGSTSPGSGPATIRRALTSAPRSASKARSSTGSPLRSSARPTNRMRSSSWGRSGIGHGGAQVDPVGHDPVAAAVEALGGPARGLGDRDSGAQLRVEAACAEEVGREPADDPARGVGVEGRDGRDAGRLGGVPGDQRGVRLVDVHEVVAAASQLAPEDAHRLGKGAQVGDRAVHREADRPAEGDAVLGQGPRLRRGAAMHRSRDPVVGVVGSQQAHVVALLEQLLGQCLYVAPDTARICVRVGRYEG